MAGNGSIDPTSYMQGQGMAQAQAQGAIATANGRAASAQFEADLANISARSAHAQTDRTLLAMGFLKQQVEAWRARFERERSTRRGHQQSRMAAQALIQKLANVDQAGAKKLIDQAYQENKAVIDASKAKVDEWNFTGIEPGKH
jgi:hypothetical protein